MPCRVTRTPWQPLGQSTAFSGHASACAIMSATATLVRQSSQAMRRRTHLAAMWCCTSETMTEWAQRAQRSSRNWQADSWLTMRCSAVTKAHALASRLTKKRQCTCSPSIVERVR